MTSQRMFLQLDTLQYVRGVPTWLAYLENQPPNAPPSLDPDELVRIERCASLNEMNRQLREAWEEWKDKAESNLMEEKRT